MPSDALSFYWVLIKDLHVDHLGVGSIRSFDQPPNVIDAPMHVLDCYISRHMVQRDCWHQFIMMAILPKVWSLLIDCDGVNGPWHRPWPSRHTIVPPHHIWCDGLPRTWAHDDVNPLGHDQGPNIALTLRSMRPAQSHAPTSLGRPYHCDFSGYSTSIWLPKHITCKSKLQVDHPSQKHRIWHLRKPHTHSHSCHP